MPYISNRSALALVPQQPFLDWVNGLADHEGPPVSLAEVTEDPEIYLIPPYEDDAQFSAICEDLWQDLFESQLEGWCTDETWWPQDRTLDIFFEWFKLMPFSVVEDLGDEDMEFEDD